MLQKMPENDNERPRMKSVRLQGLLILYFKYFFLENLKSELESERKLRKIAETKAEKTSKASRKLFNISEIIITLHGDEKSMTILTLVTDVAVMFSNFYSF